MTALIQRVRVLINDTLPLGSGQIFTDDDIQAVLDEGREDVVNKTLIPRPTYSGATIQYLNYYHPYGGFEDDYVLKQYLTVPVTPSAVEPIAGHFQFSSNIFPPVMVTAKIHDVYRASADLLERWASKWALSYDVVVGGQSFKRSQAADLLMKLAAKHRMKQRPKSIIMVRSDINNSAQQSGISMGPTALDYMSSGQ